MKRYWMVALVMALLLIGTQFAFAEGNFYIPGSADNIGGLGQDGKSFDKVHINNRIVFEGETSDTYEGMILVSDPGSDLIWTMPATSGTMAITSSLFNTTLADGKILIGNYSDEAMPYTMSGKVAITNAGVTSLPDTTDGNILVANGVIMQSVTMSGDGTIGNTGALALSANSVGPSVAFINEVTLLVNTGATTNTVQVDSGHQFMGYYISTIGGINGILAVNAPASDGFGNWTIAMQNAISADGVWTLVFLSDN